MAVTSIGWWWICLTAAIASVGASAGSAFRRLRGIDHMDFLVRGLDYNVFPEEKRSSLAPQVAEAIAEVCGIAPESILALSQEPGSVTFSKPSRYVWSGSSWDPNAVTTGLAVNMLIRLPASTDFIVEGAIESSTFAKKLEHVFDGAGVARAGVLSIVSFAITSWDQARENSKANAARTTPTPTQAPVPAPAATTVTTVGNATAPAPIPVGVQAVGRGETVPGAVPAPLPEQEQVQVQANAKTPSTVIDNSDAVAIASDGGGYPFGGVVFGAFVVLVGGLGAGAYFMRKSFVGPRQYREASTTEALSSIGWWNRIPGAFDSAGEEERAGTGGLIASLAAYLRPPPPPPPPAPKLPAGYTGH